MSDLVFYDRNGRAAAYCEDGEHIYLYNGRPVAYLREDSVFAYSGRHLGWFRDGWVRDHRGNAVFFTSEASGGPTKPTKQVRPVKSVKSIRPLKSVRQMKPVRAVKQLAWSARSSELFFAG
jgi:hypothetical protein